MLVEVRNSITRDAPLPRNKTTRDVTRLILEDPTAYVDDEPGYTALSCKLIEIAIRGEWETRASDLALLPGDSREVYSMVLPVGPPPPPHWMKTEEAPVYEYEPFDERTIVVFTGGCTWDEIAAIRRLSNRLGQSPICIFTTAIIDNSDIVRNAKVDWE